MCHKNIVEPPKREFQHNRGHRKNDFTLTSSDEQFFFKCFIKNRYKKRN